MNRSECKELAKFIYGEQKPLSGGTYGLGLKLEINPDYEPGKKVGVVENITPAEGSRNITAYRELKPWLCDLGKLMGIQINHLNMLDVENMLVTLDKSRLGAEV